MQTKNFVSFSSTTAVVTTKKSMKLSHTELALGTQEMTFPRIVFYVQYCYLLSTHQLGSIQCSKFQTLESYSYKEGGVIQLNELSFSHKICSMEELYISSIPMQIGNTMYATHEV